MVRKRPLSWFLARKKFSEYYGGSERISNDYVISWNSGGSRGPSWGPKGPTKEFLETWFPLISESGSGTVKYLYWISKIQGRSWHEARRGSCPVFILAIFFFRRNFSSLRRLKTWSRTRMANARLNGLALAYIHKPTETDSSSVLKNKRRAKNFHFSNC